MNFQQFLYWEATTHDTLDFKKIYVDMCGDVLGGLMLSHLVYWYLPNQSGKHKLRIFHEEKYWIAVRRVDWWDRIRLTPRQADRASEILKVAGLVETAIFKFNGEPTLHYRIIEEAFSEKWRQLAEGIHESGIPIHESVISISPNPEYPVTETPTENNDQTQNSGNSAAGARPAPAYGYRNRVPSTQLGQPAGESDRKYVVAEDRDFPVVGGAVLRLLQKYDPKASLRLTKKQAEDLRAPVVTKTGEQYPSPEEEASKHPQLWARFTDQIEQMPAWNKRFVQEKESVTVGKIIEFVRGYHWQGGWLSVKQPRPEAPSSMGVNDLIGDLYGGSDDEG